MRVDFIRTGGFGGIRLTTSVETTQLPPDQAVTIHKLLDDARFFELPENIAPPRPMPDSFQYRITVASAEPVGIPCQALLVGDGISTVYSVRPGTVGQFLVPGTDTVYLSGVRLDSTDYVFDYRTGSVVFWRRPEKWAPIRVAYECVRLPGLPKEYRLHELPVSSDQFPVSGPLGALVSWW